MNPAVMPTYGRTDVQFVRGEGAWLIDHHGERYLDALSGLGVVALGHANEAVALALTHQSQNLLHTSNLYRIPGQERLAERLAIISGMDNMFFGNSGAEACECAIKIARLYGHNKGFSDPTIIVAESAFHGRTMATLTATGNRKVQAGFEPLVSGFLRVPFNDVPAIEKIAETANQVTAIFVEPIQGEGGINEVTPEFLNFVSKLCKEHDLLLMLDEVQCGLGRTGTLMGWQAFCPDLEPDTISWAKSLGGGFPIGCFWTSDRVIDNQGTPLSSLMNAGSHGSTYGGNPLACAASLAVLGEILSLDLQANAARQEQRIRKEVDAWQHACIAGIRGKGLLLGFALNADSIPCADNTPPALQLCKALMENNLLTVPAGPDTLRWLPPLNVSDEEVDQALKILKNTIDSL